MLRPVSRIVTVLLLGIMLTTPSLGTMAFGFPAAQHAVPAGCHGHGHGKSPQPTPVSYKCCATGHQYAIPGASFPSLTRLSCFCRANQVELATQIENRTISPQILIPFSPGSPGSSFLRI
jgi:hypothetical protein